MACALALTEQLKQWEQNLPHSSNTYRGETAGHHALMYAGRCPVLQALIEPAKGEQTCDRVRGILPFTVMFRVRPLMPLNRRMRLVRLPARSYRPTYAFHSLQADAVAPIWGVM